MFKNNIEKVADLNNKNEKKYILKIIYYNIELSKNISKTIDSLNNADETYDIKVKYDDSLVKSFMHVSDEIKNLFDNRKEKFYYKIETLITATYF